MFVVFDLDGTLADGSHKAHLLQMPGPDGIWPEQDFQPWIDACEDDDLIEPIGEVAYAMLNAGHRVEFWTGRGENSRLATLKWMHKHGFEEVPLVHRPDTQWGRTAPDHIIKQTYLDRRGRPDLIFEDKPSVVDMWRSLGIPVAQVEPPLPASEGTIRQEKAA